MSMRYTTAKDDPHKYFHESQHNLTALLNLTQHIAQIRQLTLSITTSNS